MARDASDNEVLDFVRRMAAMAEYSDPEADIHRERVRRYCQVICNCLGLSVQQADLISTAALLHDVGKIGLPPEISSKVGDMSPYEWDLMKQHTTMGGDFLSGSPSVVLQTAELIARTHHERWDGSGYPAGLKGEEIPLSSRIVAVADVFDALTTKRNYKTELSLEDAFQLIREAAGLLFDPVVVGAFLKSQGEVQKIWNTMR